LTSPVITPTKKGSSVNLGVTDIAIIGASIGVVLLTIFAAVYYWKRSKSKKTQIKETHDQNVDSCNDDSITTEYSDNSTISSMPYSSAGTSDSSTYRLLRLHKQDSTESRLITNQQ
jgi:uncharacterized membrane protein YhiD involved in acid resistance